MKKEHWREKSAESAVLNNPWMFLFLNVLLIVLIALWVVFSRDQETGSVVPTPLAFVLLGFWIVVAIWTVSVVLEDRSWWLLWLDVFAL